MVCSFKVMKKTCLSDDQHLKHLDKNNIPSVTPIAYGLGADPGCGILNQYSNKRTGALV